MPDQDAEAPPTLRERQTERVRAEIRAAFVQLAVQRGVHAFSMHDVAEVAGVSHRTLYRYYSSREALIDDVLDDAFDQVEAAKPARLGPTLFSDDPDEMVGSFEAFEQHADLVRTSAKLRDADVADERHEARTAALRSYLEEAGVDPAASNALTALIRMFTGSDGWIRLTGPEFGLGSREAGLAAHWAAQVLLRAAVDHEGSLRPTFDRDATAADGGDG